MLQRAQQRISDARRFIAEIVETLSPDERAVYFWCVEVRDWKRGTKQERRPLTAKGTGAKLAPEERAFIIETLFDRARTALDVVLRLEEENRLKPIIASLQARGLISPDLSADNWHELGDLANGQT